MFAYVKEEDSNEPQIPAPYEKTQSMEEVKVFQPFQPQLASKDKNNFYENARKQIAVAEA